MIEKKSSKNILMYDIWYKIIIAPKSFRIRFDKIEGFIRIYTETRYLTLFGSENLFHSAIYNRIRYLISVKSDITYFFSRYFGKIKVDS